MDNVKNREALVATNKSNWIYFKIQHIIDIYFVV